MQYFVANLDIIRAAWQSTYMTKANTNETELLARLGLTKRDLMGVATDITVNDNQDVRNVLTAIARLRDEAASLLSDARCTNEPVMVGFCVDGAQGKLADMGVLLAMVLR
jgi:hypothetical protein